MLEKMRRFIIITTYVLGLSLPYLAHQSWKAYRRDPSYDLAIVAIIGSMFFGFLGLYVSTYIAAELVHLVLYLFPVHTEENKIWFFLTVFVFTCIANWTTITRKK